MNSVFFWLISALLFLILEMGHPSLFLFLSFCLGSLVVVCCVWLFSLSIFTQLTLFFSSSFILLILGSIWFKNKNSLVNEQHYKSNMHALIGKQALVTQTIKSIKAGQIKVKGEYWLAKSHNLEDIQEGSVVYIIEIRGCHCIVQQFNNKKIDFL